MTWALAQTKINLVGTCGDVLVLLTHPTKVSAAFSSIRTMARSNAFQFCPFPTLHSLTAAFQPTLKRPMLPAATCLRVAFRCAARNPAIQCGP